MNDLIDKMFNIENLYKVGGCLEDDIINAQEQLDLLFSRDYKLYALTFGAISFRGTEWTGIGNKVQGYLNVVDATLAMRELSIHFPLDYFVIENLGTDEGVVISNERGMVYLYYYEKIMKIHNCLNEYLDECIRR